MLDLAAARRMMVDGQVRPADVTDLRLIAAMLDLPREAFLPPQSAALAYLERDLPLPSPDGERWMLRPALQARLIQALELTETDSVLDVGCLSGYSAALLAALAGRVTALEQDPALLGAARDNIRSRGVAGVTCVQGPLAAGWPAGAPYDAIILEGATEVEPRALLDQLKDGGRLIAVVGRGQAAKAMLYRSAGGSASGRPVFDAAAPVLPGFMREPAFVF